MTGYQEVLTDPSYRGQIVTMTAPHIGNYGVTPEDIESTKIWAEGFVVKESSRLASNWRARRRCRSICTPHRSSRSRASIPGAHQAPAGAGAQQGVISHVDLDPRRLVEKARQAPGIIGRDLAATVTCNRRYAWSEGTGNWSPKIVLPFLTPQRRRGTPGGWWPMTSA